MGNAPIAAETGSSGSGRSTRWSPPSSTESPPRPTVVGRPRARRSDRPWRSALRTRSGRVAYPVVHSRPRNRRGPRTAPRAPRACRGAADHRRVAHRDPGIPRRPSSGRCHARRGRGCRPDPGAPPRTLRGIVPLRCSLRAGRAGGPPSSADHGTHPLEVFRRRRAVQPADHHDAGLLRAARPRWTYETMDYYQGQRDR